MSHTKKTYRLGKIKQLVDLNGSSINFDLNFKVSAKNGNPNTIFNVLVVDQKTLDNNNELTYKEVKGSISGNILADKNVYQNYFLVLKADKVCEVEVELMKKNLPKTPENVISQPQSVQPQQPLLTSPPKKKKSNFIKYILVAIIIIGGLFLLWWLYKRKKGNTKNTPNSASPEIIQQSINGDLPKRDHSASEDDVKLDFHENKHDTTNTHEKHTNVTSYGFSQPKITSENLAPDSNNDLLARLKKYVE
jgi:flagellar basal body-associated protein FliL